MVFIKLAKTITPKHTEVVMNNEQNYKVLATTTVNGNKVELRESNKGVYSVAFTDTMGNLKDEVKQSFEAAKTFYTKVIVDSVCP